MNEEEILYKAIVKAESNGYLRPDMRGDYTGNKMTTDEFVKEMIADNSTKTFMFRMILLDPEFAKAFWDEEPLGEDYFDEGMPIWQYHLRNMVVQEDLIKYLISNYPSKKN